MSTKAFLHGEVPTASFKQGKQGVGSSSPWVKKRKATDHTSTFCVVPKQVKLATCSLLGSGKRANPSFGTVSVECLLSTEPRRQDQIPQSNRETWKAVPDTTSSKANVEGPDVKPREESINLKYAGSPQPHQGMVTSQSMQVNDIEMDLDNAHVHNRPSVLVRGNMGASVQTSIASEHRTTSISSLCEGDSYKSRLVDQCSSQCAPQQMGGFPCVRSSAQLSQEFTVDHYDKSSAVLPELMSVVRVANTSSSKSLLSHRNSIYLAPGDLKPSRSSKRIPDSRLHRLHQYSRADPVTCSDSTVEGGSATCMMDKNSTHYELGGIRMQRRSWEVLKATELLAKRRFLPKLKQTFGCTIPPTRSDFHDADGVVQRGVSRLGLESSYFGCDALHAPTATQESEAVVAKKFGRQRRGQRKAQHDRLSTKVLCKSMGNSLQVTDANHSTVGYSQLDHQGYGCNSNLPLRPSFQMSKVAPPKARQRRGHKKAETDKLNTRGVSNACKFMALSEPSGLLGEFNPGIMQRVRNSEQIQAILGALIGGASLGDDNVLISQAPKEGARDGSSNVIWRAEGREELNLKSLGQELHGGMQDLPMNTEKKMAPAVDSGDPLAPSAGTSSAAPECTGHEKFLIPHDDSVSLSDDRQRQTETVAAKADGDFYGTPRSMNPDLHQQSHLIPDPSNGSQNNHCPHSCHEGEFGLVGNNQVALSMEGAGVAMAARWLELINLDMKGRLSALKRSRRRFQSTLRSVQVDLESGNASAGPLPWTSRSMVGNVGSLCQISAQLADQAKRADSTEQADTWRTLFANMDSVLGMEAAKLESWLWQINQMQAFCPGPNQSFPESLNGHLDCKGVSTASAGIENEPPPLSSSHRWPVATETIDKELGNAASAASILSTANFVTKLQGFR